jgi:4-aminobutyrate aminotransferase-like enzyme
MSLHCSARISDPESSGRCDQNKRTQHQPQLVDDGEGLSRSQNDRFEVAGCGHIGDVRGLGLMIGVELVKDEKLTPATTEAEAIRDALLRSGVLVGVGDVYGNVIRFQPPLIITRKQIDQAIDAFAAALQEVMQPAAV